MKSCVVRRRFHTSEAAGTAVTVDLEPGFGIPKACLIQYVETSAATGSFDTTLAYRNIGISMIGSTDSTRNSTLVFRTVYGTMRDNQGASDVRRQSSNSRFGFANDTAGGVYWQGTSAIFTTDVASFVFSASTPQTNGHLDCIMTFFGGDDLTVGVNTFTMPGTAGGTAQYTTLNFQPDIVICASTITAVNAGLINNFRLCYGVAQRTPDAQYGVYMHGEGAAGAMDMGTVSSNTAVITYATSNSAGPYTMTMSAITTGGFTITSSDSAAGSNNFMCFMALTSSTPTDFSLDAFSSPTGTGNSFTGTGATFRPKCIIGAATNCTAFGTRQTTSPGADSIQFFGGSRSADSLYWNGFGTITTNTAGTAVTGSSTFFHRLAPGDKLYTTDNTLIGTISAITTNTALTLTDNAANTNAAGTSFVYSNPGQYCISYGDEDAAGDSVVFSKMSSTIINMARSSADTPSNVDIASLTDFDGRNGFNLNFTTASGSSKKGFILSMKDTDNANQGRRRKQVG
ncbi:hypothetical protein CCP3SC1AL1_2730002 [Gammaproteobacteria bacterium]